MTHGTGVNANAQRRRSTSADRSNPLPAGAHFANRRLGPTPSWKVNPPRRFRQTGVRRSPSLRRCMAAGISTSSDGGPASCILIIFAAQGVAPGLHPIAPLPEDCRDRISRWLSDLPWPGNHVECGTRAGGSAAPRRSKGRTAGAGASQSARTRAARKAGGPGCCRRPPTS
jgi:hypothetical protein